MDENTITITTLNLSKVCRVCLIEHERMHSVFSELENEDNLEDEATFVYEMLQNVSTMKILPDDGLPTKICNNCLELAHTSFRFQQKCNQTQAWLEDYLARLEEVKKEDGEAIAELASEILVDDKTLPVVLQYLDSNSVSSDQMKNVLLDEEACKVLATTNTTESDNVSDSSQPFVNVKQFTFIDSSAALDDDSNDLDDVNGLEGVSDLKVDFACVRDDPNSKDSNKDLDDIEIDAAYVDELDAAKVAASEDNVKIRQRLALKRMQNAGNTENKPSSTKKKKKQFSYYLKQDENGEKVYACNLCEKTYKFHSSLQVHMRSHTLERPYVCNLCGKDFKQYGSLTYHLRSHTGEQPYACKICGKKYKQSGTLTAHMRVHTGQKPFLCSVCGRGFRQAPDLGYHMRTHTKEKPYMCNICGKTMSMQCHLVQHMRTHTGERPFKCTECSKAFPSSTRLKRHAIIHTGLKPYTCDVCDKSFNRISSLRVHSKIHTDERPYVCHICGKGFIQSHGLRAHVITHSPGNQTN